MTRTGTDIRGEIAEAIGGGKSPPAVHNDADAMDRPPRFDPTAFSTEPSVRLISKPVWLVVLRTPAVLPYTGKLLHINAGARLSRQLHDETRESWFLLSGRVKAMWQDTP